MFNAASFIPKPCFHNKLHFFSKKFYSNDPKKKVAIVLSGCGALDGSEIHETAAVVTHLSKLEIEPMFYSLSTTFNVVDHYKSSATKGTRNTLVESARIARGKITSLDNLMARDASALVFPGGLGVTKTLTTFEKDGSNYTINEEVCRVIMEFNGAQKPMAFMCISPIIPIRIFPRLRVTFGKKGNLKKWPYSHFIDVATELGANVETKSVDAYSFDQDKLVLSTPAFMFEGSYYQIFEGIGNMIDFMYKIMP